MADKQCDARPSATIHYLGNPNAPPFDAIISVARQLQDYLYAVGAIPEGQPAPFPELLKPEARG